MKYSKRIALAFSVICALFFMSCVSLSGTVIISDDITNGTVTADKSEKVVASDIVTLTVTPNDGYDLETLTVMPAEGKNPLPLTNNTFEMPFSDVTVTATFKQPVETKTKPDALGDVVLNDGTAVAFENVSQMSAVQKSKAIAVIYYIGTECSNNGEKRMLGVGLLQATAAWDKKEAETGFLGVSVNTSPKIETIACNVSVNTETDYEALEKKLIAITKSAPHLTDTYVFTGDKDGSDNWSQLVEYIKKNGLPNDTAPVANAESFNDQNYPAFYFAKDYKDYSRVDYIQSPTLSLFGSNEPERIFRETHLGEGYKDGWYVPSIVELFQLWKNKDIVDTAITVCGGDSLEDNGYMSSSQYEEMVIDGREEKILGGSDGYVYALSFSDGNCHTHVKNSGGRVCVIHSF